MTRICVVALALVVVATGTVEAVAQSICGTPAGACRINGIGQPGGPCFCFTPAGPVQGLVAGGGGIVPQVGDPFPHFCCTPAGRMGPYPNTSLRAGQMCTAVLPNGAPVAGQACY
jgi:hypothetical protein